MIVTARSAPTEKTENHFIQADASTIEGATKVINEILNRFVGAARSFDRDPAMANRMANKRW